MSTPAAVDLGAMFEQASGSVARVEAQELYTVKGEEPYLRAFRDGTPRPERSVRTNRYLARAAAAAARGVAWDRLRVVDTPLTPHQLYQVLAAYPENDAAGDTVWIAERRDLAWDVVDDFWVVDGVLVHQDYDLQGHHLGNTLSTDPDELEHALRLLDVIRDVAVPLNVYRARLLAAGLGRAS